MQKLLLSILLIGFSFSMKGKPIFLQSNKDTTSFNFLENTYSNQQTLEYKWDSIPDQTWLGYSFWANSYLDWKVKNGKVIAYPFFSTKRSAYISKYQLEANQFQNLTISADIGLVKKNNDGYAGFIIGAGGHELNEKTNLLIHNNSSKTTKDYLCYINNKNELVFKENSEDHTIYINALPIDRKLILDSVGINLKVKISSSNLSSNFDFQISRNDSVIWSDQLYSKVKLELSGSIGLTYNCKKSFRKFAWFNNLEIKSDALIETPKSETGSVIAVFYSYTPDSIFITAQLQPLKISEGDLIVLGLDFNAQKAKGNNHFYHNYTYDSLSHQARYRIKHTLTEEPLQFSIQHLSKRNKTFTYKGVFKPVQNEKKLKLMTLNCNGFPFIHGGEFDYTDTWYAYEQIEKGYQNLKPDVVVFLGDQFYESRPNAPIYKEPFAFLDYLYKWNLFCFQFRDLTANSPTLILTDDHDVFHGNLWGDGGVPAKTEKDSMPKHYDDNFDTWQQDNGGYMMSDKFVNMAIGSQTSHLPRPYHNDCNAIKNYYTSIKIGKYDFAILEDKKFKSPPSSLNLPIFNGVPLNDSLTPQELNNDSLNLLGNQQLEFLQEFLNTPSKSVKIILTQSAYASLTTIDSAFHPLNSEPASPTGIHKLYRDMDSNGWPKNGVDKAMEVIAPQRTFVLAGDQHMGSVVELYDSIGNSTHFYTSPAVNNTWPRTWYPSDSTNGNYPLGLYFDGFGNKMNVKAVANPNFEFHPPHTINRKSPGFGVVEFNYFWKTATIHAYPLYFNERGETIEFEGWPIKIKL